MYCTGAVTFISFIIFGLIPILGYIIFPAALQNADMTAAEKENIYFIAASVLTVITMFILGAMKVRKNKQQQQNPIPLYI